MFETFEGTTNQDQETLVQMLNVQIKGPIALKW